MCRHHGQIHCVLIAQRVMIEFAAVLVALWGHALAHGYLLAQAVCERTSMTPGGAPRPEAQRRAPQGHARSTFRTFHRVKV